MSWMLGVACSRRVLQDEGYQWVAPASAFYPNVNTPVSIPRWHPHYPPSRLEIDRRPTSSSKLRPDYIAIRPVSGSTAIEWALAESKGTRAPVGGMACPASWAAQVRSVNVKVSGRRVPIARHLVIATRINPNAILEKTRRLQVKAWNSSISAPTDDLELAKLEVIAASLFGICRNLDLIDNANAIAQATRIRHQGYATDADRMSLDRLVDVAGREFKDRGINSTDDGAALSISMRYREGDFSNLHVKIERATLKLMELMQKLVTPAEEVRSQIGDFDREIFGWYENQRKQRTETRTVLPEGIVVQLG
ncbi:hypothetical protein LGM57_37780 [Burkholderia cepacia]|uniref:hypothetical protein n=1 Tax=Burkholderia cepacia TaxID=292 RepID=UPI001CF36C87|nr:hypothetical protein [Burkholderia cepacia]MCA7982093.1 hypothetical protein [Burkholderia cepacia]